MNHGFKGKTTNHLGKKTGENLWDLGSGKEFLNTKTMHKIKIINWTTSK